MLRLADQPVHDAPGEGAVRAAALQGKADPLHAGLCNPGCRRRGGGVGVLPFIGDFQEMGATIPQAPAMISGRRFIFDESRVSLAAIR